MESLISATSYRGRHAFVCFFGRGINPRLQATCAEGLIGATRNSQRVLIAFPNPQDFAQGAVRYPNHVARRGEGASCQNHDEGEVGGVSDRTDRLLLKDRMQRMERSAIAWTACFGRTRSMPSAKYVNSACVSIDQVEHYARAGHMRSTSKQWKRSLPIIWSDINELAQQRDEVPSPTTIEAHHNFPGALEHESHHATWNLWAGRWLQFPMHYII